MSERVPRASISARFLDDEDVIGLLGSGDAGARAVFMYVQLLILAKQAKNEGRFAWPIERYAARLSLKPKQARELWNMLQEATSKSNREPWLVESDGGFIVRSWGKWNEESGWGGARPGAGRPGPRKQPDKAKVLARNLLYRAVQSGRVVRPDVCSQCLTHCVPHGHHADYSKPLEVEWLCTKCHRSRHPVESNGEANAESNAGLNDSNGGATVTVTVTDTSHSAHPPQDPTVSVSQILDGVSRESRARSPRPDAEQRADVAAALARYRIAGVAARVFLADPRVTAALLDRLAGDVAPDARNGSGILVSLVCRETGLVLPKRGKSVGGDVESVAAGIRRSQRQKAGRAAE